MIYFPAHAAKNIWKKKFFEEKRKTAALEEQVNRLRHEVDAQHKTLMAYLESKGMLCRLKMITGLNSELHNNMSIKMAPNQSEVTVETLHGRYMVQFWPSLCHAALRFRERGAPPRENVALHDKVTARTGLVRC